MGQIIATDGTDFGMVCKVTCKLPGTNSDAFVLEHVVLQHEMCVHSLHCACLLIIRRCPKRTFARSLI